jgi:hypothetical protein
MYPENGNDANSRARCVCPVAGAAQRTVNFFIHSVTENCTANSAASAAASLTRRSEGLSRVSWKLSGTVLRGAVGGTADRLLDQKLDAKTKQPFAIAMKRRPAICTGRSVGEMEGSQGRDGSADLHGHHDRPERSRGTDLEREDDRDGDVVRTVGFETKAGKPHITIRILHD